MIEIQEVNNVHKKWFEPETSTPIVKRVIFKFSGSLKFKVSGKFFEINTEPQSIVGWCHRLVINILLKRSVNYNQKLMCISIPSYPKQWNSLPVPNIDTIEFETL